MIEKITMIELFSGIGAQERALRQLNIPYKIINTCDCDKDAVLSYAAMRTDLNNEIASYPFPSAEDMIFELQSKNVGYDFMKDKHTITTRTPINKLKQYYLADKRSKNLGDIGKIERLPYADMVTYSFPCFIPGTMVLTENGYKNIEDIQEGDMVLTHTNQYQKVVKPMQNYCNSQVYKINAMCSDPIYATEEHPFYVRKRQRVWNNDKRKYDRKFNEPEWVKVKNLTKDYYVGVAINQKAIIPKWDGMMFHWSDGRRDRYSNKLGDYMGNEDFWWIIGRYLGDGWLVDGHGERPGYGIKICCAKDETFEITNVLYRLGIRYTISSERTVNKIQISMKELYEFCLQFGRGAENKRLTQNIIDLPINLLKAFLNGYISADGSFTQNKYKVTSVSKELIYGIGQCVAKVYNVPFSVYKTERPKTCIIEGRIVNQKNSYDLTFKTDKRKQDHAFYDNGYIWCPIKDIYTEPYNGYVYNMEVENDNSYVVQNIIVHNCTDLSVAGKGEGMQNKCSACGHSWPIDFSNAEEVLICPNCGEKVSSSTRSGLLGQVQRLLSVAYENNELPKYLLLENVKNLVGKKFVHQFNAWIKWLDSIGYNTYYEVLNAKHYGIPQNRERIFALSIRKDVDNGEFKFPNQIPLNIRLKNILEKNVDEKYYIDNDRVNSILYSDAFKEKLLKKIQTDTDVPIRLTNIYDEKFGTGYAGNVWDTNGISPTLQTAQGGNRQPLIVEIEPFIIASRGRNPENPSDRTVGIHTEQTLEPNFNGVTNCITSVQKDNWLCEPIVCEERRDEGIRLFADESCGTLRTIDACGDKRVIEFEVDTIKVKNQATEFADFTDVAGTLLARDYKGFGNQEMTAVMETHVNTMSIKMRIRKLTTKESYRLMGFSDEDHNRAAQYVSASALYKQAGNSICTSCLVAIFNALFLQDYSTSYANKLVDYHNS